MGGWVGVQVCRCEMVFRTPLLRARSVRFVYEIAIFGTDMAELVGCHTHPVIKLSFAISKKPASLMRICFRMRVVL